MMMTMTTALTMEIASKMMMMARLTIRTKMMTRERKLFFFQEGFPYSMYIFLPVQTIAAHPEVGHMHWVLQLCTGIWTAQSPSSSPPWPALPFLTAVVWGTGCSENSSIWLHSPGTPCSMKKQFCGIFNSWWQINMVFVVRWNLYCEIISPLYPKIGILS